MSDTDFFLLHLTIHTVFCTFQGPYKLWLRPPPFNVIPKSENNYRSSIIHLLFSMVNAIWNGTTIIFWYTSNSLRIWEILSRLKCVINYKTIFLVYSRFLIFTISRHEWGLHWFWWHCCWWRRPGRSLGTRRSYPRLWRMEGILTSRGWGSCCQSRGWPLSRCRSQVTIFCPQGIIPLI